ncbi:MAG: hypothetical protein J2P50_17925 [Hyphomicrobiaceae bacterium]|nr:hypothetical protein [Hyphomicrobiaceae bacterium]
MIPIVSDAPCFGPLCLGPKDFVAWIKPQGSKAKFTHGDVGTDSRLCAVMMGDVVIALLCFL